MDFVRKIRYMRRAMKQLYVTAGILTVAATAVLSGLPRSGAQEPSSEAKPKSGAEPGIREYIVVRGQPSTFDEAVNAKLREGYQLQGGICVLLVPPGEAYAQAMVR